MATRPLNIECQDLNKTIETLERLLSISRRLNSTLEMRPLLQQIVESAADLTDADGASILLMESEGILRFAAATGPDSTALVTAEVPIDESIAGWVVKHREMAILEDAQADSRIYNIEAIDPTRSIIAAPLIFGDEVIGVLESVTTKTRHQFSQRDQETMESLAATAAVAVKNARLFQQSDWVAEVVHEIRTPLTAILSYADLLLHPGLDDAMRVQFVGTIQHETERVAALATQFLDLARLESGRITLNWEPLDLSVAAQRAADIIRPNAEHQERELSVHLASNLPAVLGDRERLHQVLLNLLSNAVKYSDPGDSITLSTTLSDHHVVVAVTDTGPGIPEALIPQLFQKFRRLPGSEAKATGTGLGLVVAQQIVEAHRGRLWVESKEGEGSTFYFWLPVHEAETATLGAE